MKGYMREYPDGPVLHIDTQKDNCENLAGCHVHMCPECFDYVPCADTCTWNGDYVTNQGVPICHAVICERCQAIAGLHQDQGAGI